MYFYIFLIIVFLIIGYHIINDSVDRNFPPGPTHYPLIGSWLSLPARGVENKIPDWRKKYGNIIGYKLLSKNVIFIGGSKEIITGLCNSNFQRRNPAFNRIIGSFFKMITNGLFMGDDKPWSEVRKFTIRYMSRIPATTYELVMHNEMMDLFARIKPGEIVEVTYKLVNFAANSASIMLLGDTKRKYVKEIDKIQKDTHKAFREGRTTGFEMYLLYLKFLLVGSFGRTVIKYGERFFQKVTDEHRASFDENNIRDFIDAYLLQQKVEKESLKSNIYNDQELCACLSDLIRISGESTGNTQAFILLYVVLNPEVQKKIHEELDAVLGNQSPKLDDRNRFPYIDAVIQETIRINSIAPLSVVHMVSETTDFCGFTFPKNSFLQFSFREVLMDPEIFEEPHKFKPERFFDTTIRSKMIAFGLGKRSCVGKTFALNTLFLFTAYFFQKYSISLPSGYENPSTEAEEGFSACPSPFKIIIDERRKEER